MFPLNKMGISPSIRHNLNYEYSTRNDTISANSPVASARANPRIAYVNSCPRSA
jgi:hypothetical protein